MRKLFMDTERAIWEGGGTEITEREQKIISHKFISIFISLSLSCLSWMMSDISPETTTKTTTADKAANQHTEFV
jgi:adenylate kinase